jgi:hypothetical protein
MVSPVGASLDERAVIVRDHVDLQHLPGQQRDHSEFERLRPSAPFRERRIQSRWRRDPFSLNEGRRGTRACFRMLITVPSRFEQVFSASENPPTVGQHAHRRATPGSARGI